VPRDVLEFGRYRIRDVDGSANHGREEHRVRPRRNQFGRNDVTLNGHTTFEHLAAALARARGRTDTACGSARPVGRPGQASADRRWRRLAPFAEPT
jgi:hypothetical protein